jgi:hypothetical protein
LRATILLISQLIVINSQGPHLDESAGIFAAPRVFPHNILQEIPPTLMASMPTTAGGFPVFEHCVFRLDGLCPASDDVTFNWLAEHAVPLRINITKA